MATFETSRKAADGPAPSHEEIVEEIRAGGGTAASRTVDVTDRQDVDTFLQFAEGTAGKLDVLINNAGVFLSDPDERRVTADGYEFHFQVNYLAGYELIRILTPLLEARGFAVHLPEWAVRPDRRLGLRLAISPADDGGDTVAPSRMVRVAL